MNLSPEWLLVLKEAGWVARHWQEVGVPNAPDEVLLAWARQNKAVILTRDLDFAKLLFQTGKLGPSVVLLRVRDDLDRNQQTRICALLHQALEHLDRGALLVIDEHRARLRTLPIDPMRAE